MKSHFLPVRFLSSRFSLTGSRSLLAVSALFVAGAALPVAAQESESEPTAVSEATAPGEIVAVFRSAAPKELLPKIMEIARQIQPGPQTEALPFILGGMLGDPSLQGISPVENIGMVLLANGSDVTPVVVLNLTEESPLSAALTNNFGLTLKEHEGWTLGVQAGTSLDVVAGREQAFIDAVRETRRYDLEVVADMSVFTQKLRLELEPMLQGEMPGQAMMAPVMEAVAVEADAMERAGMGLNLSKELIEPVYFLNAKDGTPLAAFLDQEQPENLEFAKFIEADGMFAALSGYDVEATQAYIHHVLNAIDADADNELMKTVEDMAEVIIDFLGKTSGAQGTVMSLNGLMPTMVSVAPSTATDAELQSFLTKLVEIQNSLFSGKDEMVSEGDTTIHVETPSYAFAPTVAEIDGLPVHSLTTDMKLSGEEAEAIGFDESLAEPQEAYYVLVDGYIVNATSLDELRETAEAIQGGEAVENNLADLISLQQDELFRVQMNLLKAVEEIDVLPIPMEMATVLEELQAQNLPPFTASFSAVDGDAEARIGIPVKTIAAVAQAIQAQQEAQRLKQMQEAQEPDVQIAP